MKRQLQETIFIYNQNTLLYIVVQNKFALDLF